MQCGNAEACGSMAIFMQFDSISYNLPHPLVRPWSSAGWVVQCTGTPRAVHKCIRQHAVFDNFALGWRRGSVDMHLCTTVLLVGIFLPERTKTTCGFR